MNECETCGAVEFSITGNDRVWSVRTTDELEFDVVCDQCGAKGVITFDVSTYIETKKGDADLIS